MSSESTSQATKGAKGEGPAVVRAAVLIIGNEILSGRTQDANLAYLGHRLNELGIRLVEGRVLPDVEEVLVPAIADASARFDYVFTTGGIGPTHDDITVDCVAKAFGVPVIVHPEARRMLEDFYGTEINPARLRMARTPEGAGLIENSVSVAPGIHMRNVFVLAGIPKVMQAQFEASAPGLVGGLPMLSTSVPALVPESVVAPGLEAIQASYPDLEIGSYPFKRGVRYGTSLVVRGTDAGRLAAAEAEVRALVERLGGTEEAESA